MRRLWILLVLSGCLTVPERHAILIDRGGDSGSAVDCGFGFWITATHVISDEGGFNEVCLIQDRNMDSSIVVLDTCGDVALFRSSLASQSGVVFGSVVEKDVVWYVQPAFSEDALAKFTVPAVVVGVTERYIFVDRAVYGGSSGSGVFNASGELVGVVTSRMEFSNGYPLGIIIRIPQRFISRIKGGGT